MKKFAFPLDRVLAWRNAQVRLEEIKLQALHAELRALDLSEIQLEEDAKREFALRDGSITDGLIKDGLVGETPQTGLLAPTREADAAVAAPAGGGALIRANCVNAIGAERKRGMTGQELAALGRFTKYVAAEKLRIAKARSECRDRIQAQVAAIAMKRRDAKLLENLKEKRLRIWHADLTRQTDQDAEELFLGKWRRIQ